ncbi:MAG: FHA domain-containing protein [Polyangiaceae bacterium]
MPELSLTISGVQSVVRLGPYEALGRGRTNTIIVEHPTIEADHAFLERRGGKTWLFDLGSSRGTYVGRDRNRGEGMSLLDGDELRWGDVRGIYREEVTDWGELFVSREEQERALAAAVRAAPDDEVPRYVFGDWLEARGELARAEYVRRGPESFRAGAGPVAKVDNAFVAVFDRSPIEGCPHGAGCPAQRWDRLRAAGGVRRRCDHCQIEVAYCCSESERDKHRLLRRPIVLGAMVKRSARGPYRAPSAEGESGWIEPPGESPAWDHHGASLIGSTEGGRWLFPITRDIVLGREPSSDIVLGKAASRRHMRVFGRDGGHWIEDLQSSGGTYVHRAQLRGPTMLRHGDEFYANPDERFVYRAVLSGRL